MSDPEGTSQMQGSKAVRRRIGDSPWQVRLGVAVLAGTALLAIDSTRLPAEEMPPLAPQLERPDEYAFGDAVMRRDTRAWGRVFDTLAERLGRENLSVIHLVMPADADPAALHAHFDAEMIDLRQWRRLAWDDAASGSWIGGYESPDGRAVFVLVGLEPRAGETELPLTVITTLAGAP
jgi:hypothetical protein